MKGQIMNLENNKILMFLFRIFFPRKYELYLKRKKEEAWEKIQEYIKRIEEKKNIEKYAMVGGTEFRNKHPITKRTKIDNIRGSLTFYLKKKKTGRTIVVKGTSFEDIKNQYGEEYDFVEPMIKDVNDEWDYNGELIKG